ncbi:MAG: hypothetical protein Q7T16_04595 [Candidatus Burarchaeum sp.]|nr:hypothetical protein [Candidatus Burarchaeum sp.]MDO8339907.1 hypothetical protein [Candidatus Burarchaeum sp.]
MKLTLIILSLLLVALLFFGCTQNAQTSPPPASPPAAQQPEDSVPIPPSQGVAPAAAIIMTLDVPATSVAVGEDFTAKYTVENKGPNFRGYLIQNCKTEKYPARTCGGRAVTYFGKFSSNLHACEIKERSSSCALKKFESAGTYTYELALYSCEDIENALGTQCSDADEDDVAAQVTPIEKVEKTVTVTEN